jgi:hypothetical protein
MDEDEKEHRFRPEIVKEMAKLGFFGVSFNGSMNYVRQTIRM